MTSEDRLFADLVALEIPWRLTEHEAVFTVEQSARIDREIAGAHTKNLFLKDASARFWLVTVPAVMRVDLKQLPAVVGGKKFSFGNADDMLRLLGVLPGSVTPLAAINDTELAVTVVLDASFLTADRINIHPLRNTATIGLLSEDLIRLLKHWHHNPVFAEIPASV